MRTYRVMALLTVPVVTEVSADGMADAVDRASQRDVFSEGAASIPDEWVLDAESLNRSPRQLRALRAELKE